MGKSATSIWKLVLQISLAVMLIVAGLNVFSDKVSWWGQDDLVKAVANFAQDILGNKTITNIVRYTIAIIEIACGIFLVLNLFKISGIQKISDILIIILMICWALCVVLLKDIMPLFNDGFGKLFNKFNIVTLAKDLIILASFGLVKAKI